MLEGWDIFHLKRGIHSSVWSTKIFFVRYQEAEISSNQNGISDFKRLKYWTNLCREIWCLHNFSGFLIWYRNICVLQMVLWITLFKWNMSQSSSMFVARENRQTSDFKTQVSPVCKSFEIWYPILICWYLSFLISYRNFFVLQTELWIPLFKWN